MELRYSFDPDKWYLGTLCIHGHKWPGTELSLRRNYKRANRCAACCAGDQPRPWLQQFIDYQYSGVPSGHTLGKLCRDGHSWNDTGYSLRKAGKCVECGDSHRDPLKRQATRNAYYQRHAESLRAKARESYKQKLQDPTERAKQQDPTERAKQREAVYRHRAKHGRKSRSRYGFDHGFLDANEFSNGQASAVAALLADGWDILRIKQHFALNTALRSISPSPSVARLVYNQQMDRWRQHPDERRKHARQWSAYYYAFRYKCDPAFRRHECQRNSERKAKNRGNHTVRLSPNATAARFAQFDNSCAYCGSTNHLIVEHFIPRAKGGPHVLGNILPSCQRCNVSKRDHEPEQWYCSQPFFTLTRWRKILAVLGKGKAPVQQLPLL
jgi:5-methylcytosine-specific restriction endonuclease McrA